MTVPSWRSSCLPTASWILLRICSFSCMVFVRDIQKPSIAFVGADIVRCIGCLGFAKDLMGMGLLKTLALVLLQGFSCWLLASLLSDLISLGTMRQCMNGQEKLCFGLQKIPVRYIEILASGGFRATSLSIYDFSSLYTTLPTIW